MVYLDLVVIIAKKRKCTTVADLQLAQCVDETCRDWLPAVMSKLDADDDWAPPLQQIQSGDWRRVPVAEWTPMAAPWWWPKAYLQASGFFYSFLTSGIEWEPESHRLGSMGKGLISRVDPAGGLFDRGPVKPDMQVLRQLTHCLKTPHMRIIQAFQRWQARENLAAVSDGGSLSLHLLRNKHEHQLTHCTFDNTPHADYSDFPEEDGRANNLTVSDCASLHLLRNKHDVLI
jgi:hypothetical protein